MITFTSKSYSPGGPLLFLLACFALLLSPAQSTAQSPAQSQSSDQSPAPPPATSSAPSDSRRFDPRSFGAKADGTTLDTAAIQAAIRAASTSGGGTVHFTPGTYLSGTIELLSNVTLDLAPGATLKGSPRYDDYGNISQYGFARNYGVDSTGEGVKVGLIVARKADNIAITGAGTIDGSGPDFFDFTTPHYSLDFDPASTRQGQAFLDTVKATGDGPAAVKPTGRAGTMIVFTNCTHVLLRDITLRDSPNWTLHLNQVHDAVITAIHILNEVRIPNNDGIDCFGCRNVQVSDSYIRTGDDDFAIVGGEDITVTNCTMSSASSAIRLEDTRYSTFSNLVIHANRGIGIYERGSGTTASILFSDIVLETHLLTGHWWGKGEPIYIAAGTVNGKSGTVRDIRFSNISGDAESGIVLYGDPHSSLSNISFDQLSLRLRVTRPEVNAAVGGNFDFRWVAESPRTGIFAHDIPAFYARYIDGLTLHGFDLQWAGSMPAFYSSAIELEDASNIAIDRFAGRQANTTSPSPVIELRRASGISITNSRAATGTATFLSTASTTGLRLFTANDLLDAHRAFTSNPPAKSPFLPSANLLPPPAHAAKPR